jgi:hypothetical protein
MPHGRVGAALKQIAGYYPAVQIGQHLNEYLSRTEPKFINLPNFAATFGAWAPRPLVDQDGVLIDYGGR